MFQEPAPQRQSALFDASSASSPPSAENDLVSRNHRDGHWTEPEIFRFIAFLVYNRQTLKLKLQRRTSKVFKQMSEFIETRTAVQCRSQNQRLFRKFKNFRNIISAFKAEYGKEQFQSQYREVIKTPGIKFRTELENLVESQSKKTSEASTQTQETTTPQRAPQSAFRPLPTYPTYTDTSMSWSYPWSHAPNVMIFPYFS